MGKSHICFLHQNYPAQFGPISQFLLEHYDVDVSFLSQYVTKPVHPGVRHVPYQPVTTGHEDTPYFFARHFEECTANMHAILNALKQQSLEPDVFVGHAAFGTLGLLHAAFPGAQRIGFFEFFYHTDSAKSDSRKEFTVPFPNYIRIPLRNAVQLVELEYCTKGYSPTAFQRSTYPEAYKPKIDVLFDGVDTTFYTPGEPGSALNRTWPSDAPIVTFVSRGLEAMRGFDIFMEMAHTLCQQRDDVHFVIAGRDKTHYGSEGMHLKNVTFKQHVLSQRSYDLSRFHFMDWVSEAALVDLFRLSTCHVYWTVPFTLSWSLFQAMSAGVYVLGSDTGPLRDLVQPGVNGHLVNPYDIHTMVERVNQALDDPNHVKPLREAARQTVVERFGFDVCLPKLAEFYTQTEQRSLL
jgi:glycosyltransferase involved in cell wall biosynthesis